MRYRRQGAILIQDNASYHKDSEAWAWFKSNRHWLEVHSIAAQLAGVESHRTALAAHPQQQNAQPVLWRPGCATRYADACLRRDAIPPATDPVLSGSFLLTTMAL